MKELLEWASLEPKYRRFQIMWYGDCVNCWRVRLWSTYEDMALRGPVGYGYGYTESEAFHMAMRDRSIKAKDENSIP
jgi:hypothetical protein